MTKSQMAHLKAARDGNLFLNDRGGPVRRAVWVGGKVSQKVCAAMHENGTLVPVPEPGCDALFRYNPSPAALAALRAHDEKER